MKLVRSSPPASGGHFFYVIVRPHHSKGNRELPIVAIWSPKRRAANKLRGKRGRQQTAARRTRGHGMARKRAGGAPKNERIGRKRMGKLASGRQALVVGAVCLAVLFLWPRLGTLGAKVPSSLVAVIVGVIMVPLFGMNVSTIGDLYTINAGLPELHVPQLSIDLLRDQLPNGEGGIRREGGLERAQCERRSSTTMPDRLLQDAQHSPSTISPLIGRSQEERASARSTPASRNRHATRGRLISLRRAARIHRPSRRLQPKPSQPHERQHRRQQPRPFPRSRVSSP